jgi:MFS family permease
MTLSRRAVTSRTFDALGNRNYRFFFAGQTVSVTGSWLQATAQAWLILELTHSPLMLGLLLTVQYLPNLLLQPFGGVVGDRWPKRRVLILTQSCFAITAAVLGIIEGLHVAEVWEVFVVVAVFGVISVVDGPTRQAFVPEMVGKRRMSNAVALNSMVYNGARVIGPAIAGGLIATVGTAACFDLNAVSYLAAIGGLLLMRPGELHLNPRVVGAVAGILTEVGEAVAYVRRSREVVLVIILMAIVNIFSYNLTIMITALARTALHAGASGFGLLSASLGAGALVGALGVAYMSRASIGTLLIGCGFFGLCLALGGQVSGLTSAMALLALAGGGLTVYSAMSNSVVLTFTPGRLQSRVMSLYLWVFLGTTPLGSLFSGGVEQAWGSRVTMALGGSIAILAAAGGTWWWMRNIRPKRAQPALH